MMGSLEVFGSTGFPSLSMMISDSEAFSLASASTGFPSCPMITYYCASWIKSPLSPTISEQFECPSGCSFGEVGLASSLGLFDSISIYSCSVCGVSLGVLFALSSWCPSSSILMVLFFFCWTVRSSSAHWSFMFSSYSFRELYASSSMRRHRLLIFLKRFHP